jgi:hypothetical protein
MLLSYPYSCAFFVISIVRVRGSNLWRFLANGKDTQKIKDRGIQVASVTWPNHGIKIVCLLCCFSVIVLFTRTRFIATWSY